MLDYAIILSIALTSIVGASVKVFPSEGVDFGYYKTFEWLPPRVLTNRGLIENEPTVGPLIEKAIKAQLTKKGFTEAGSGADVQVSTFAMASAIPQMDILFSPDYTITWGVAPLTTVSRYIREGTLGVNLIDPRTKRSIWIGIVTKALKSPNNREKDIDKAAAALFKKYPQP
jgi:hypothetical protein